MFSFGEKKLSTGLKGFTQSGFLGFNSFRRLKEFRGMTWNSRKQGFTLIELLIVIAIIALLSSVVMASLSTARMKARDSRRIADLNQIKIALEMYYDANGNYPTAQSVPYNVNGYARSYNNSWIDLATKLKPYINPLPKDPINSSCEVWNVGDCYSYEYGNVGNGIAELSNTRGVVDYDLTARFETQGHPLSCLNNNYKFHFGNLFWCGSYSKQIYEASPM